VVDAGATTLNIPDTTGWNTPWEFGELIATLRARLGIRAERVVFSTHCQNDLGLASANSLAGAYRGARQIECTINGIGERAGNAALEEVVMALHLRGTSVAAFADGPHLRTGINPTFITPCSRMVSEYTGMAIQPHKAIVGANAFRHESGIHQDGMIKNKATYEIMTPESIGLARGQAESGAGIVLGKHSGRNAVSTRLIELGYENIVKDQSKLEAIFTRFKHVAERKKGGLDDDELEALISDEAYQNLRALWTLIGAQVTTGSGVIPSATVSMQGPDGVTRHSAVTGSGPVDAVYKAIDTLTDVKVNLETYSLESVNAGIDAMATTKVIIKPLTGTQLESAAVHSQSGATTNRRFSGSGTDTDIVISSARAYVAAVNKLLNWNLRNSLPGSGSVALQQMAGGYEAAK
jgi:2-isopropylmalate synthase